MSHSSGRPASRRASRHASRTQHSAEDTWLEDDAPLLTEDFLLDEDAPRQKRPVRLEAASGDAAEATRGRAVPRDRQARRNDTSFARTGKTGRRYGDGDRRPFRDRDDQEREHGSRYRDARSGEDRTAGQSFRQADVRGSGRGSRDGGQRPEEARSFTPSRPSRPFRKDVPGDARHVEQAADNRRPHGARTSPWREMARLLPQPDRRMCDGLDQLGAALSRVRPLTPAHARSLPEDVARLSRLLTVERAGLHQPYWASPALTSAYLYYFLPWNVLRQMRLLAALPLPDPREWVEQGRRPVLLDLGSGPLSLPLALWLARPEWRSVPLEVVALDNSSQPLELGRAIFQALGDILQQPAWQVRTVRAPLGQAARQLARLRGDRRGGGEASGDGSRGSALWLVSAANVLNELLSGGAASRAGRQYADDELDDGNLDAAFDGGQAEMRSSRADSLMSQRMESLMDLFEDIFEADAAQELPPSLLVVEPGTRLGGTTVMRLRSAALERGLVPLSPCTHAADCPLERGRSGRGWCHFTFDCSGAPQWLEQLAGAAGLEKSSLSLAPLLLSPGAETLQDGLDRRQEGAAPRAVLRVLSAPFDVPGLPGRARYACGVGGLALLGQADNLSSGGLLETLIPEAPLFDRRSGALLLGHREGQREASAASGIRRESGHERARDGARGRQADQPRPHERRAPRAEREDHDHPAGRPVHRNEHDRPGTGEGRERPARADRPEKRRYPVTGRPAARRGSRS